MLRLSDLEQAVLDKLLEGDHLVLTALREQASQARVSSHEYSGVGFFCSFEVPTDVPPLPARQNLELGDVDATIDGLAEGAGFVLFVRGGRLSVLEGFTYDEPWPAGAASFRLSYRHEPRNLRL